METVAHCASQGDINWPTAIVLVAVCCVVAIMMWAFTRTRKFAWVNAGFFRFGGSAYCPVAFYDESFVFPLNPNPYRKPI